MEEPRVRPGTVKIAPAFNGICGSDLHVLGASIGYANDHAEAIELVRSGEVDLAPFVTSRILVDDLVEKGIERLMSHKDEEVKILVSMR